MGPPADPRKVLQVERCSEECRERAPRADIYLLSFELTALLQDKQETRPAAAVDEALRNPGKGGFLVTPLHRV
jgi:hypothetical protein